MQVVYERCCGLDVHKRKIVACLLTLDGGKLQKDIRTFSTTTNALLALLDWLTGAGCTHVAMESTGVYWKPVYNILEGHLELLVVNAQHLKAVPGRKTDVKDAEWIAELLQHGLLKASFVPPKFVRELRDLTRTRTSIVRDRAQAVNRLQKILEDANIKLASVATDITGRSGRAMLRLIITGETDEKTIAELAKGRMRAKLAELEQALIGAVTDHHRFLLAEQLNLVEYYEGMIERLNSGVEKLLLPFQKEIEILDSIPGVSQRTAEVLLAEIGTDMTRFPTHRHLASWAGMCPGNKESGGKRLSGKTRKGSPWLKSCLIEAAHGASHTKDKYLSAQYRRLVTRRGKKRALVAVGHSILVIGYHLLLRKEIYKDLGGNYFDEQHRRQVKIRLVNRLERLGYKVALQEKPAA
ncbi:MAG: IS110 family transposase [Acidobacteria bacterium]|nr:MAG: IS110 family transposase [Acidobacteriota bacterium]PYV42323.1 MAG: IS110 family transposase [Acidobacteriota bacterium]